MRQRLILVGLLAFVFAGPVQAGIFRKSPKPDPAVYVPALIQTLKSEKDERGRVAAANALRDYDAKAFPEILPALIDALANDSSTSVRAEAAESIGRIRPISTQAGYALEQAKANDKDLRVRIAARTALLQYRVLGYFVGVKDDLMVQTAEPPLAPETGEKSASGATVLRPTPSPMPVVGPVAPPTTPKLGGPGLPAPAVRPNPQTGEPPLANPAAPAPTVTAQPRSAPPIITIPPVPTSPVGPPKAGPSLPPPKELPGSLDSPKSSNPGPALPPPPKG